MRAHSGCSHYDTIARKLAERLPEGYATPMSDRRMLGEPLFAAGISPHYCVNIIGHGWRKLMRHRSALTYRTHSVPPVPPVLSFLQQQCRMNDSQAYPLTSGPGSA